MADQLDRVRISAAELRAEASNALTSGDTQRDEQHLSKQHKRREEKRPDLQRYQPVSGRGRSHRDSEGDTGQGDAMSTYLQEQAITLQSEKKFTHEKKSDGTSDSKAVGETEEGRIGGDGSNSQNCKKASPSQGNAGANQEKHFVENEEHVEPAGAQKPSRKARKPDREFYQPGSRRNILGKDSGKEQDKPPTRKPEQKNEHGCTVSTEEAKGNKTSTMKQRGNEKDVKVTQENSNSLKSSDTKRRQENRDIRKPPLSPHAPVEKMTNKVEKLCIKDDVPVEKEIQDGEELTRRREEEKKDKREKENRRRRAREKEKVTDWDSRGGRGDGVSCDGKPDHSKEEKDREKRAAKTDKDNKVGKMIETHPGKRRENVRESKKGGYDNNNRSREVERNPKMEKNEARTVEKVNKNAHNAATTAPCSKRYSKSDIRHSRNRTYSSSSASSVTSLDGRGSGKNVESCKWSRMQPKVNNKDERFRSREDEKSHSQSWPTNGESSTESLEGSEMNDIAENRRRRRRGGEEELRAARRVDEKNVKQGSKSGGGGILRVSLNKQTSFSSQRLETNSRKEGSAPRGRGGGILVLPARTDISNSSEVGQRLFGGLRRGGAHNSRGGRGGGVRRLWDPNNPDQKPALTNSQSLHHKSLPQSVYLQTGSGYGQLHFLDTDDEAAGSPPVPQGQHFQSQQAAAMAFYKFQNSDNPYGYPMSTSNPGPNPNLRFSYPYMTPYQVVPSNGMYNSPGVNQVCGTYKVGGYSQPGAGGGLTLEEAEQQARGELGKLLRAADAHEHQLSNLLSRDRVSADGLERMAQLRADLLVLYEQVILTDIEFSDSQNVDQALWKNVFYQVIEHFRQILKDHGHDGTSHIRKMLLTLLDEGSLFFDALLQKLQTVYQFTLEDYMDGMAIRTRPLRKTVKYALISAQRCMICQGDIARYREQATDSANYGKARSWYLKAQQIAPKNGRPYNQLALLAVYTKRKMDAVYYYMRSLAASNPILTAKESLMSLFEEAKRKTEQLDRRRRQEREGGSMGPTVRGRGRGEAGARVEIWIRPSRHAVTQSSQRGGSESSRDSEQDGDLGSLSASDLNKRFTLSFLHAHGKLFTKVGMESFPGVASRVLLEFRKLLQHGPSLLGSTHMLQIITINMFTIHNAQSRGEDRESRSVLQEQSTALGLGMFALLVQRCTELLRDTPAEPVPMADGEDDNKGVGQDGMVRVSAFPQDLTELLPTIKVWSDWMLGHPDLWNPPPCSIDPDVWQCLADLCNVLAHVDHEEVPLYKVDTDEVEGDEELTVLQLKEDKLLAGFIPLLAAPQEPCYIDNHTEMSIAADCKRVTVLKYFLEALCGQEEPLLAFKGGKYVSVATSPPKHSGDTAQQESPFEKEADDVVVEAESSLSASEEDDDAVELGDSENDIRELKARRHVLANKLALQQRRRDKIQAMLQTSGQLELEVRPLFLVPDTNGFIDHLEGLKKLLQCGIYIIVVPLIVITELDGLAKGQDNFVGGGGSGGRSSANRGNSSDSVAHFRSVQDKARLAVEYLEKAFEAREPCLRALTSRGNQLESIAFRSEDTSGQQGNNDDVILSCCLHYCKDKAKDFMPDQRNGTVRLHREVVLLTDDRNLRVKALTRNVPVRDISAFLSWAKVG